MTEAMPFLQKYDITFLRPPTIQRESFVQTECLKNNGSVQFRNSAPILMSANTQ